MSYITLLLLFIIDFCLLSIYVFMIAFFFFYFLATPDVCVIPYINNVTRKSISICKKNKSGSCTSKYNIAFFCTSKAKIYLFQWSEKQSPPTVIPCYSCKSLYKHKSSLSRRPFTASMNHVQTHFEAYPIQLQATTATFPPLCFTKSIDQWRENPDLNWYLVLLAVSPRECCHLLHLIIMRVVSLHDNQGHWDSWAMRWAAYLHRWK